MKRVLKIICFILTFSILLAVPVLAEEPTPYASTHFGIYSAYLFRTSSTSFQIWFEVDAKGMMDKLGVSSIVLQQSVSGGDWETIKTFRPTSYPSMMRTNTASHTGHVSYAGISANDYRAYVTFYAENSAGSSERSVYAYFL